MQYEMKQTFIEHGEFNENAFIAFLKNHFKIRNQNIILPKEYMAFLRQCNGGMPKNSAFNFSERGKPSDSEVRFFFGFFENETDVESIQHHLEVYDDRQEFRRLPIKFQF